eukprot:7324824-Ditylum_brightwellii.AAC.2
MVELTNTVQSSLLLAKAKQDPDSQYIDQGFNRGIATSDYDTMPFNWLARPRALTNLLNIIC